MGLINTASNHVASDTEVSVDLDVEAGDYIVVAVGLPAALSPPFWLFTDSDLNEYQWEYPPGSVTPINGLPYNGFYQQGAGAGQNRGMGVAYAIAQQTGTVTITAALQAAGWGPTAKDIIAANLRDVGIFDQLFVKLTDNQFGGPTDRKYSISQQFNLADTFVCCFAFCFEGGTGPISFESTTGDTLAVSSSTTVGLGKCTISLFTREEQGPGNSYCEINAWNPFPTTRASFAANIVGFTFSKPLARPVDLEKQFAVRGGVGFNSEDQPRTDAGYGAPPWYPYNRPLIATYPYEIEVGDLLFVFGNAPRQLELADGEPDFEDDYGNTYNDIDYDLCTSDVSQHAWSTKAAWCRVTAVPAAGEPFQVRMTQPNPALDSVYQQTNMGIAMYVSPGDPVSIQMANWDSQAGGATVTITSETIGPVPANALLLAYASAGGGAEADGNNVLTWSELDGYTIQEEWNVAQQTFAISNYPKQGTGALFDKIAPSTDNYNATIEFANSGAGTGGTSALVLLAIVFPSVALAVTLGIRFGIEMPAEDLSLDFELQRVAVTLEQAQRLNVRGTSR